MKLCLFFSLILLIFSAPAFGQLSTKDIEAIDNIVKESEARMKEYVAQEIAKVNVKIDALDRRLTTEIGAIDKRFEGVNERFENMDKRLDDINKRLDNHFLMLLGSVGFVAVVIGIPQIIVALQRKHQRLQDEKIEQQYRQIQVILEEIKTLKQNRIINP